MSSGLAAIAWVQAWSGAPLYLMAAVLQGIWLHRHGFMLAGIMATAVFTTTLTILASLIVWDRYLSGIEIMLWNTVNLPALIATCIVFPVVTVLIIFGFADPDQG